MRAVAAAAMQNDVKKDESRHALNPHRWVRGCLLKVKLLLRLHILWRNSYLTWISFCDFLASRQALER
jgi:hypothetical protein